MATKTAPAIGRNVRAELARNLKTQSDLARMLGISQSAAGARLRGVTPFKADELITIAAELDVTVAHLYGEAVA